jgi:hypothetical protein
MDKSDEKTPLLVPLWPAAGKALHLNRAATYAAAVRGDIPAVRFGKLYRVSAAWLRQIGNVGCAPEAEAGEGA